MRGEHKRWLQQKSVWMPHYCRQSYLHFATWLVGCLEVQVQRQRLVKTLNMLVKVTRGTVWETVSEPQLPSGATNGFKKTKTKKNKPGTRWHCQSEFNPSRLECSKHMCGDLCSFCTGSTARPTVIWSNLFRVPCQKTETIPPVWFWWTGEWNSMGLHL